MVEKNPVMILSRATLSLLDFRKSDFFENVWHRSEFFYSLGNNQIVIVDGSKQQCCLIFF
jgi:hypothetical protein